MKMSGDERMAKAEAYFRELAALKAGTADRETYEHLRHVAETVQETLRLLEHMKMQMEDLRHKVAVP
ncbi:MAG TPA: hypothetical protein VFS09_02940 [Candidatus Eisenbacteria bacterium]|nr:hypothetical protein [Candidatus Eisenbacteria bacterium]